MLLKSIRNWLASFQTGLALKLCKYRENLLKYFFCTSQQRSKNSKRFKFERSRVSEHTIVLTWDAGMSPCANEPAEKDHNQPFCTSIKFRSIFSGLMTQLSGSLNNGSTRWKPWTSLSLEPSFPMRVRRNVFIEQRNVNVNWDSDRVIRHSVHTLCSYTRLKRHPRLAKNELGYRVNCITSFSVLSTTRWRAMHLGWYVEGTNMSPLIYFPCQQWVYIMHGHNIFKHTHALSISRFHFIILFRTHPPYPILHYPPLPYMLVLKWQARSWLALQCFRLTVDIFGHEAAHNASWVLGAISYHLSFRNEEGTKK